MSEICVAVLISSWETCHAFKVFGEADAPSKFSSVFSCAPLADPTTAEICLIIREYDLSHDAEGLAYTFIYRPIKKIGMSKEKAQSLFLVGILSSFSHRNSFHAMNKPANPETTSVINSGM